MSEPTVPLIPFFSRDHSEQTLAAILYGAYIGPEHGFPLDVTATYLLEYFGIDTAAVVPLVQRYIDATEAA